MSLSNLSICLSILQDFLGIWKLETEKLSFSAGLPSGPQVGNTKNAAILQEFLNFEVDNIKNEAILLYFLQQWKVECWVPNMCF